jgi:hypothetical protein
VEEVIGEKVDAAELPARNLMPKKRRKKKDVT